MTIVSTKSNDGGPDSGLNSGNENKAESGRELNTIREMFNALSACWIPPPEDEARPGMQMTVRFSFKRNGDLMGTPRVTYKTPSVSPEEIAIYHSTITAALNRCTPLPLTPGLGGAVAGRPIAVRFVDDRKRE